MFRLAKKFNQPINNWITSSVTNMEGMFQDAKDFNRDISGWDTSNVTNMGAMFRGNYPVAMSFDQNIGGWNTSKVMSMNYMFVNCPFFQDISGWVVSDACTTEQMFHGALYGGVQYNWGYVSGDPVVRMNDVRDDHQNIVLSSSVESMKPKWKSGVAGWLPIGHWNSYYN